MYIGYARKSTQGQSQASFDVQIAYLKKLAEDEKLDFTGYTETGSGSSLEHRPILQKILNELQPNDVLGVYDGSRLGRNNKENFDIAERIASSGAKLQINGKYVDITNPSEELAFGVETLVSTFQRKNQNRKSLAGIEAKKRNGEWIFTSRLHGYDVSIINGTPHVSINEAEAEAIRHIFQEYSTGSSTHAIAGYLNKLGYVTKDGKQYYPSTVRRLLLKPIYMGKYPVEGPGRDTSFDRIKIDDKELVTSKYYEPIVSEDLWWTCYKSHRQVKRKHTRQFEYRWTAYPLSSVIRCACGRPYVHSYHKSRARTNKVNSNYVSRNHSSDCTNLPTTLRAEVFEYLFQNSVYLSHLWSHDILAYLSKEQENVQVKKGEVQKDIDRIDKRLAEVASKKKNLITAIESGLDLADIKTRLDDLTGQEKELTTKKAELSLSTLNDEEQLEYLADMITDEHLYRFINMNVQERRTYYLNNLEAVVNHYELRITFFYGLEMVIELKPNHGRYIQTEFEVQVLKSGKLVHTFSYSADTKKMRSENRMMQARLDSLYREIGFHSSQMPV